MLFFQTHMLRYILNKVILDENLDYSTLKNVIKFYCFNFIINSLKINTLIEELSKSPNVKILDLGVQEGAIRKNSLGVDGAKYIAAIILQNPNLEIIKLQDNDIGTTGAQIIGTALKSNKSVIHLKIAENELKTAGTEYILKSASQLQVLDLSKNYIKSTIGPAFRTFLKNNQFLRRLNLEFNELGIQGIEQISLGLCECPKLIYLNLKGNGIRDEGLQMVSHALSQNDSIEELDLSLNDITPVGICYLAQILPNTNVRILNLAKNLLGDESLIMISNRISLFKESAKLEKIDISSSKVADKGILHFLEQIEEYPNLSSIRAQDNFISEKIEKILLEVIEKNKYLIELKVSGNRLSQCCLSRIDKIMKRNKKSLEEREPNKIRTEIYRLKYEQKKIMMAREKLQIQEKEIIQIEEQKNKLVSDMEKIRIQESMKRQGFQDRIDEHRALIEKKKKAIEEKQQEFEKAKVQKSMEIDHSKQEYDKAYKRRTELEVQEQYTNNLKKEYQKLQEQLSSMENHYKSQINGLEEQIMQMKEKTKDVEDKTTQLNEEYRLLMKKEAQLKEAEIQQDLQKVEKKDNKKDKKK